MWADLDFVSDRFISHKHLEDVFDLDPEDEVGWVVEDIADIGDEDFVDGVRVLLGVLLEEKDLSLLGFDIEVSHVQRGTFSVSAAVKQIVLYLILKPIVINNLLPLSFLLAIQCLFIPVP